MMNRFWQTLILTLGMSSLVGCSSIQEMKYNNPLLGWYVLGVVMVLAVGISLLIGEWAHRRARSEMLPGIECSKRRWRAAFISVLIFIPVLIGIFLTFGN